MNFQEIIKGAAQRLPLKLQQNVGLFMDQSQLPDDNWSSDTRLHVRRGRLFKSFAPQFNKPETTDKGLTLDFGSDLIYADIHEKGKFIKSKGKMPSFFWAKYAETQSKFYKIMALSVKKKGGVKIPKRPYFEPAMERFENKGLNEWLVETLQNIIENYDFKE